MDFIKKHIILLFILLFSLIITSYIYLKNNRTNKIEITILKIDGGYGYLLNANNKILIKQKHIPAIQKKRMFCTKKEALKIAELVKTKILNKENPAISVKELKNQNINLNGTN